MNRLARLPRIMVAPNGARLGRADHPRLPLTLAELLDTAAACHAEGAGALHAHLRDAAGRHLLDAGAYRELLAEMAARVPAMPVQITTEAGGRYRPEAQRRVLAETPAEGASVARREMLADGDTAAARRAYADAAARGMAIQHILYHPDEVSRLLGCIDAGTVPDGPPQILFVLGRYGSAAAAPADLAPYLAALPRALEADWAACAFGPAETACLAAALAAGGKARVGFENNVIDAAGRPARDNAARVREIAAL